MSTTIKVQVSNDAPAPTETVVKPDVPTVKSNDVEKFLLGPSNPLHDLLPAKHTTELQTDVLLQANDIKETLQRIFKQDPTARCHNFPYAIYQENAKILNENGFSLRYFGSPAYTEVSWDSAVKFWLTIPTVEVKNQVVAVPR